MTSRFAMLVFGVAVTMLVVACGEGEPDVAPTEVPRNTATATATERATESAADAPLTKGPDELLQWDAPPPLALESDVDYQARITTNFGEIVVDLFEGEAPNTVNNFVFLAEEGFYENVPVHRIIAGFMFQSGDPTGTGSGGPGYRFNDEPIVRDYVKGTLAMANAGANTNGSQFFITLADLSGGGLDKRYTIFGEVIEGIEVADQIAAVEVTASSSGERSKPVEPVYVANIEIIRN